MMLKLLGNFMRGNNVISGYFNNDEAIADPGRGWFGTGDIDQCGWIFDDPRPRKLIKSGGEWISSIDLKTWSWAIPMWPVAL